MTSNDLLTCSDGYGWYMNFAFESLRASFVMYIVDSTARGGAAVEPLRRLVQVGLEAKGIGRC
jgi:hypothetical protein